MPNFKSTLLVVLLLGGPWLATTRAQEARKIVPPPVGPILQPLLAGLTPSQQVQSKAFDTIAVKTHLPVPSTLEMPEAPLEWAYERHQKQANEPSPKRYMMVGEELRVAQALLADEDKERRHDGLRLALVAATFTASNLKDKPLAAAVHEGFLLPALESAYPERWQDIGRQRLLEAAAAAFGNNREISKQNATLRALIALGEVRGADQNSLDWARGTLAQNLAAQKQYGEAIALLRQILSPGMQGVKRLIPQYEKLLAQPISTAPAVPEVSQG